MSKVVDIMCPIWKTEAKEYTTPIGAKGDSYMRVYSPRAGGYYNLLTGMGIEWDKEEDIRRRLSYWIWQENMEKGINSQTPFNQRPTIDNKKIDEIKQMPMPSVKKRIENVALHIFNCSKGKIGFNYETVVIEGHRAYFQNSEPVLSMQAASYSIDDIEFARLLINMGKSDILRTSENGTTWIELTLKGHEIAEEAQYKYIASEQAFVAMWFDDKMDDIYEKAIAPAIEDAGYHPYLIKNEEHNNKIDDQIIAEIRRSRFIVADFTHGDEGARGSVYYEAGFAHGLNIPVIFTCAKELEGKIHFDTRQFKHIFWEDGEDLKKQLIHRIGATIGQGPVKKEKVKT